MADLVAILVDIDAAHGFQPSSIWLVPPDVFAGSCVECERDDGDLVCLGTVAPVVPVGRPDPWRTARPQPAGVASAPLRAHSDCISVLRRDEAQVAEWVAVSPLPKSAEWQRETTTETWMMHYRDGYHELPDGQVQVACDCGWRSDPIVVSRGSHGSIDDAAVDRLDEAWVEHIDPLITPDPDQVLILADDRHHLAGEPLTNGTALELLLPDDTWWRGRYETTRADGALVPLFFARIGGPALDNNAFDFVPQVHFKLPPDAVLRRPSP